MIGYGLVKNLFDLIDSDIRVPENWTGIMNTTYKFGGKLKENRQLRINVYGERKVCKVNNVIGIIRGSIEPGK